MVRIALGQVNTTVGDLDGNAALLSGGEVVARYHKMKLPNYGVFDEARTFVPGDAACPIRLASSALGISVCEDAWWPGRPWTEYEAIRTAVIPNINSSPYHRG